MAVWKMLLSSICSHDAHIFYIILVELQGYVPTDWVLAYKTRDFLPVF